MAVVIIVFGQATISYAHSCCEGENTDLAQWWDNVDAFSMGCGTVNAGAGDTLIPALILILLFIFSLGSWKK
jgi:hypothetical protein